MPDEDEEPSEDPDEGDEYATPPLYTVNTHVFAKY